jgi:hypothetical protein
MATHQSPLAVVVKGALAGAAGTAAMNAFLQQAPAIMERVGLATARPPTPPAKPTRRRSATEKVVERATTLPTEETPHAAGALHWGYGAAWGAYYAVIQSTFRPPPLLHGTWLAGLMTFVAVRVLPMVGLAPAPRTRDQMIVNGGSHAVYGWATALAYSVLNFGRRG